ncbi:MAG: S-layer homology domain-containing protein [Nitrospirota bacterium]
MRSYFKFLYLVLILISITACAKPAVKCTSPEDNPPHHYLRGMENIEQGKVDVAKEKFERSLYCDEKFSPAHSGLAIVYAEKAKAESDPKFRVIESERAKEYLKKADKFTKTDEDKFIYFLAVMRVNTILKEEDWLEDTKDAFDDCKDLKVDEKKLIYYQGVEAADYFMGLAYLEAKEFQKARDKFADVLNMKREGKWHEKADRAWKRVDKIVRAMAGITVGDVGKQIAIKDTVTRADLAALLIDELKLNKLFAGRIPSQSQEEKMQAEFTPADVLNHKFKEEVLTIMKWKVRGLEPRYDEITKAYLFKPAEPVLRKEMALILEDVLIKLTGDETISTAYFGHDRSPFPDVKPTAPWYNAVMNMTTRGIMEPELSGDFRAESPVDGAEAILAIRVLRQKLNIY